MVEGQDINNVGQIKDDKILISFKPGQITTYDFDFVQSFGVPGRYIPSMNGITLRLHKEYRPVIDDVEYNIRRLPNVYDVKRNVIIAHSAYDYRYYQSNIQSLAVDEPVPRGVQNIRAQNVHNSGNKGDGIKVCVHDTGVDYTHPDLSGNYVSGANFVGTNSNDPMDDFGHGTHVAGTIAANGSITSVAPNAKLYASKSLDQWGSGAGIDLAEGLQWAIDQNVNVINMSWGGAANQDWSTITSILQSAYDNGILLVAAAGNSNADASGFMPAKLDIVVCVAALDSNFNKAYFSNYGSVVDISAPGTMTYSTSTSDSQACLYKSGGYLYLGGTSMAAPHISGIGALLKKAHPDYSTSQLMTAIRNGGIPVSASGMGSGLSDAPSIINGTSPPSLPSLPGYYYTCINSGTEQGKCNTTSGSGADTCAHNFNCMNAHYKCGPSIIAGRKECKACGSGPYNTFQDCKFDCLHQGYICSTNFAGNKYCKYVWGRAGDPLPEYKNNQDCEVVCEGGGGCPLNIEFVVN